MTIWSLNFVCYCTLHVILEFLKNSLHKSRIFGQSVKISKKFWTNWLDSLSRPLLGKQLTCWSVHSLNLLVYHYPWAFIRAWSISVKKTFDRALKQPLLTFIIRAKKNCVAYFEGEKSKKKSRAAFYNHLRQPGYPFFRTRGFPDQSLNWFGFFIIDIESTLNITIIFIIRNNYAIFLQ